MHVQMGVTGRGSQLPPPEKSQNVGFLSNTGPDPLKNQKATKPAISMLGHYRPASKTPFKWPMMALFSAIWILSPLIQKNFLDPHIAIWGVKRKSLFRFIRILFHHHHHHHPGEGLESRLECRKPCVKSVQPNKRVVCA